jgi:DNA polymerase-4
VTLKLKRADFRLRTRAQSLAHSTQLAGRIFDVGRDLLATQADGTKFRLIGIGISALARADGADLADLVDRRTAEAEQTIDGLRERFGEQAIMRGLCLQCARRH